MTIRCSIDGCGEQGLLYDKKPCCYDHLKLCKICQVQPMHPTSAICSRCSVKYSLVIEESPYIIFMMKKTNEIIKFYDIKLKNNPTLLISELHSVPVQLMRGACVIYKAS